MNRERVSEFTQKLREKVFTFINRVMSTERDRRAVMIGAVGVSLMILYLVFHSFSSGAAKLEKRNIELHTDLEKIKALRTEYIESKQKIRELSTKIKTEEEALISVVEKILIDENIERKNFSIKDVNTRAPEPEDFYSEKSVDVDLKQVSLRDLLDILYKLQSRQAFLKVSNLRIKTKFDKPDLMNVSLRISSFKFNRVI